MNKSEAAKALGYSKRTVVQLVRDGCIRINKDASLNKHDIRWWKKYEGPESWAGIWRSAIGAVAPEKRSTRTANTSRKPMTLGTFALQEHRRLQVMVKRKMIGGLYILKMLFNEILDHVSQEEADRLAAAHRAGRQITLKIEPNSRGLAYACAFQFGEGFSRAQQEALVATTPDIGVVN